MRLTICGGGGFRVPLVHGELLRRPELGVSEVVLHDTDEARLTAMSSVLRGRPAPGPAPAVRAVTRLDEALLIIGFESAEVGAPRVTMSSPA